tara:strand:+ start:155 stop:1351 length:1197 start_codon:yes stop_codon:yes gene_type:complete
MIKIKGVTDIKKVRRLALHAQGLTRNQPFGKGALAAIEHLGYIQLDSINVIERAHNHTWSSRVPGFTPDMSNELLESGQIYEYWAHAASYLPMKDFRFSLPDKKSVRDDLLHKRRSKDRNLMASILKRIETEGPLGSKDFEDTRLNKTGWWDWKPAKQAIEVLYLEGDLMISSRKNFQKTYDLTERVLPEGLDLKVPTAAEWARHLVNEQLACHGIVHFKNIAYGRRDVNLRKEIKSLVETRLASNELVELTLPEGEVYLAPANLMDRPLPKADTQLKILSPFDNLVIQRKRLVDIFDFDYLIECYVPAAKRRYGYFSLPLLFKDRMVGRIDCKALRAEATLQVNAAFIEVDTKLQPQVCLALAKALRTFSTFQGCYKVKVESVLPHSCASTLKKALA